MWMRTLTWLVWYEACSRRRPVIGACKVSTLVCKALTPALDHALCVAASVAAAGCVGCGKKPKRGCTCDGARRGERDWD